MAITKHFIPDRRTILLIGLTALVGKSISIKNHTSLLVLEKQVNCNFDADLCLWTQSTNDSFDWTRQSGETASGNTGPENGDRTTGSGYYMFIESSAPRRYSEAAKLVSHDIDPWNNDKICFSFWYNMNGDNIGTLQVVQTRKIYMDTYEMLWSKSGNQGPQWIQASIPILPPGPLNVIIEGTVGAGYLGDIAIDDMKLTAGDCPTSGPSLVG